MINVTRAYLPNKNKLLKYIDCIYESAWLTNYGRYCQELEKRLQEYLGVKHLILVSNGTLALQIAYKALEISGSAVTTPFSFVATASSLKWEGIRPIFSDIDSKTWNLDAAKVVLSIESDTSAIVPVHVFGNPCEVELIDDIARRRGLKVIYDGAHAFGVKYKGESVLNWGDVTTLSFHATKLFHTIEGGALITSDDELAKKIRLLINFGITGPEVIECVGINCKMNEFQAVMGLCVLDEMEEIAAARKSVWEIYANSLGDCVQMQAWNTCSNLNHHYFPVLLSDEKTLRKVQGELCAQDIFPRRYFFPSLDSLTFLTDEIAKCAVSQSVASRILCLPIFASLTCEDQQKIISIIRGVLAK